MHWIQYLPSTLLLGGALLLAYQPLGWLLGSWTLPGYPRSGPFAFALVLLLAAYSLSSPKRQARAATRLRPKAGLALLLLSAGVRAGAQVGDINLLGALVLAVDVYALALLLGTGERLRPVAPFWLAVVFCFCLPLEPWLQRLLGAQLQWLSAQGACGLLALGVEDVVCDGVRLVLAGVEVLVDLACSGSQLLIQASLLLATLFALRLPSLGAVVVGVLFSLVLVWLVNALRIALLALGLAYPPWGLDLMAPLPHTLIGLACFALLALVLLAWVHRLPQAPEHPVEPTSNRVTADDRLDGSFAARCGAALCFACLALFVVRLDAQPIDRTPPLAAPYIPAVLTGLARRDQRLTPQEQTYYATYGGVAVKASYGNFGLLVVRTGAPIRHLHAPEICLGGMGFRVDLMGTDLYPVPTTVYRAQRKATGEIWQVRVNYMADNGVVVASLSEVAWRWLKAPGTRWTMVQRLIPWSAEAADKLPGALDARLLPAGARAWDTAILRAFNLFSPVAPSDLSSI